MYINRGRSPLHSLDVIISVGYRVKSPNSDPKKKGRGDAVNHAHVSLILTLPAE
jgi:hypothetical protein